MLDSLRSNPTVRALAELYTGTFLSGAWAIIIPTIPVLAREFGVSAGGAAQVVTAFALGKFVGTAIGGIVLDRMGTRFALVGGPMAASDAALGAAWVPWFTAILALALIMGAADSLWATAREIAGIDLAQRHQRGQVISSLHGTYNIGTAMGPFLGGWITDVFSFKAAFVAYAIASALSVFLGIAGPDFPVGTATKKAADPGSVATSTYDVVPAHVRGRLQAVRRTVAELGSGLAPLFGGYLANTFNPGVPFLFYAPLLAVSATLLAVVGKETLER
jgi:MFS family permease